MKLSIEVDGRGLYAVGDEGRRARHGSTTPFDRPARWAIVLQRRRPSRQHQASGYI